MAHLNGCGGKQGICLDMKTDHTRSAGIDSAPGAPSPWWSHRAIAQGPGLQVQLRQDDLPKVLRTFAASLPFQEEEDQKNANQIIKNTGPPPSPCHQLQKEEVRTYQPAATKEEAQVDGWFIRRSSLVVEGRRAASWPLCVLSSISIACRINGTTVEPFPHRSLRYFMSVVLCLRGRSSCRVQ